MKSSVRGEGAPVESVGHMFIESMGGMPAAVPTGSAGDVAASAA
jgi:hypothetical protein